MKRKWRIVFDGDRTHPWVALPESGSEAFFVTVESLIRFLTDGGLHAERIVELVKILKTGKPCFVELNDPWKK